MQHHCQVTEQSSDTSHSTGILITAKVCNDQILKLLKYLVVRCNELWCSCSHCMFKSSSTLFSSSFHKNCAKTEERNSLKWNEGLKVNSVGWCWFIKVYTWSYKISAVIWSLYTHMKTLHIITLYKKKCLYIYNLACANDMTLGFY